MSAVLLDVESQFSIESHDRKVTNATISEQLLISLLNEDHTYLYYLILILKLSGLYSFPSSPRRYFTYFIIFIMWLAIVSVLINLLLYPSSEHLYHQIGNAIWMIHAASTYTIVAYDMIFLNGRLLIFMNSIISRQNNQYFTNYCLLPETYCRNLKLVSCLSCIAVICGVIGNIISIGYLYFTADGLYLVLRVTRSLWFDVLGFCLWYFFSYGWVISIPFVCIPIYALNCRIESMIEFIKTAEKEPIAPPRPSNSKVFFSLEKTMSWYDELHTANRLLVFNISMLLTVDIVLCSILSVFLLHSFVLNELTGVSFAGYVWITINTLFVLAVSAPAATLYAKNVHISEALGAIKAKYQFTEKNVSFYQLALLKIDAIPLGVPFYNTKQFITWNIIIKVMTFVTSFYLFIASTHRTY